MAERRTNVRRGLFETVVLQSLENGDVWRVGGYDISGEGFSIRSKERFNVKHNYIVSVKLNNTIFSAECQVINHTPYKEKEFKVGFIFTDMTFENKQKLKRHTKE